MRVIKSIALTIAVIGSVVGVMGGMGCLLVYYPWVWFSIIAAILVGLLLFLVSRVFKMFYAKLEPKP